MRLIKIFSIFLIIIGFYLTIPRSSLGGASGQIIDYYYDTHYSPGETVTFTVTIKNTDTLSGDLYIQVALTNSTTGIEVALAPQSGDTTVSAGQTVTLTTGATLPPTGGNVTARNWPGVAGRYSVTIILYKYTGSGSIELDRKYGSEPVHVGSTTDSVAAFPRVLDFGALQYGRYMHPMPIEINWSFYSRSSQIRKDHPWYMRIYTDNHKRYKGIDGAIYSGRVATQEVGSASAAGSPAGLISEDGKYTIPLKVWCLNFGPDVEEGWDPNLLGPPPVKDDYYWKGPLLDNGKRDASRVAWEWIPDYIDMSADNATWRKLIGQDPFDTHYVSDSNPTGDFTLTSPFQIFIGYETSPTAVVGKYSTDLIIEIYSP